MTLTEKDSRCQRPLRPRFGHLPSVIAGTMLFAALLPLPWGYYTLLRVALCMAALYSGVGAWIRNEQAFVWLWGVIAVLFNPLAPFSLGRSVWTVVDIMTAILFWGEARKRE